MTTPHYRHLVFDIDGTMLDTEHAWVASLQDALPLFTTKRYTADDLHFILGITGEETMRRLGIDAVDAALEEWNRRFEDHRADICLYPGVETLIRTLKAKGKKTGIVTSEDRDELQRVFVPFALTPLFDTIVCLEDTPRPKPAPDPLLTYIEKTGATKSEVLFIGDSEYDSQAAQAAGVDFGLALWGSGARNEGLHREHSLFSPSDVLKLI